MRVLIFYDVVTHFPPGRSEPHTLSHANVCYNTLKPIVALTSTCLSYLVSSRLIFQTVIRKVSTSALSTARTATTFNAAHTVYQLSSVKSYLESNSVYNHRAQTSGGSSWGGEVSPVRSSSSSKSFRRSEFPIARMCDVFRHIVEFSFGVGAP